MNFKQVVIIVVLVIAAWFAYKYVKRYMGAQVAQQTVESMQGEMSK